MTSPETTTTPVPKRRLGRTARLALVLAAPASVLALSAAPAAANPPAPHDPIGAVESVTVVAGAVHFHGWGADPDTTASARLYGLVDGHWAGRGVTSIARPAIAASHHTGPTPGFDFAVPVPAQGVHTACIVVQNAGPGLSRVLKCVMTPLGTKLTAQQRSAHSPSGVVSSTTATASSLHVAGWAAEPDFLNGRIVAAVYVDGRSTATIVTHRASAAQLAAGAGKYAAFSVTLPVSPGAHLACVWLVNTGIGSNTGLGCRAADTRGPAGIGAVTVPSTNAKVVQEAKRHIGQPYVWGAAGPTTFDCSGLVMYSYRKAGLATPRIAADQFSAARLIPAARAVAGDLVFYHDSVGAVYHVGIYVAPLDTVAAIDEQEGIAHQHIWDPSTATYGSFTHN